MSVPDGPEAFQRAGARRQPTLLRPAALAFAIAGGAGLALGTATLGARGFGAEIPAAVAFWAMALGVAAALGVLWLLLHRRLLAPLIRLAAETKLVAETRSTAGIDPAAFPGLAPLPAAVALLARRFMAAQAEIESSVASATRRVGEQKERLEAILRDLSEGVLVCNLDHQVLLYNQVALSLLHVTGELGLGRSLFNLVTREPVLHGLERLVQRPGAGPGDDSVVPLVCATVDSRTLLSGRMSLIVDEQMKPTGYVLTFTDATREIGALSRRDALLRAATEGLRGPIANLRAAAETLSAYPEMQAAQRRAFEEVIVREGTALGERLEALDRDYRSLSTGHWPLADVHSTDLFNCVARSLAEGGGPVLTLVGVPLWLHCDSHALALALERILRKIAAATGATSFDIEGLLGDRRVYLELAWPGPPIPSATLEAWSQEPLPGAPGAATLGDVLARHGSEMWSRPGRPGWSTLRLPLPAPERPQFAPAAAESLPPRPEFYDFDLLRAAPGAAQLARPLKAVPYVVFDTETTGLRPSHGDELVSIGAVRIVNGRLLTGETFLRLINPKRPIPPESVRFHGITDAMVETAPPAEIVLPQFRSFVADSVLVAHNAAFDLRFLALKEEASGVRFDNVVLDTLLISAFLYPDLDDHSLDTIAERLAIPIPGRHTALGDALATAAVFVRFLELLEARGIATLGALLDASKMALEIRARQAAF